MLPTGTLTQRSSAVDSSIMEGVVEMKIDSLLRVIVTIVAKIVMKNNPELSLLEDPRKKNRESLNKQGLQAGLLMVDRKIAVYSHMHQEIVANKTEGSTMTEVTAFVVSSCTLAVMEMKTTLKHWKIVKVFAMMPLAFAT